MKEEVTEAQRFCVYLHAVSRKDTNHDWPPKIGADTFRDYSEHNGFETVVMPADSDGIIEDIHRLVRHWDPQAKQELLVSAETLGLVATPSVVLATMPERSIHLFQDGSVSVCMYWGQADITAHFFGSRHDADVFLENFLEEWNGNPKDGEVDF